MSNKKGLSLVEVIIVMVIISILAGIAYPNYLNMMEQGMAKSAVSNLITILGAEKNYAFNNNSNYCNISAPNATCADTLAHINTNLNLNISDNNFTYWCVGSVWCYALRNPSVYQIALDGVSGTTLTPTGWPNASNPSCINLTGSCPTSYPQ